MHHEMLKKVIAELAGVLPNARVGKIHQPAADVLVFRLRAGQENLRLLISASPDNCRIHLTEANFPNPSSPPRFCQLLRARVTRILSVQLLNDDRIVSIGCNGPKGETSLVVELTGRNCNMLLLDAGALIIDALHRVVGESSGRKIMPGQLYVLPEKNLSIFADVDMRGYDDSILSANASVDKFYTSGQSADNKTDLLSLIKKAVIKKRKKLQRRMESIAIEEQRQSDAEHFKQAGELLLANLHAIRRGMDSVALLNYYLEPPATETLLLDSRLSPTDNAGLYFKRYKKAKRGLEHSQRRMQETRDELAWLDSIDYSLLESGSAAELEEIAAECRQNGLLPTTGDRYAKKSLNLKSKPLEALSPSGFKVLCGRNNKQNDYLSTKELKPTDLWFHAHKCPGAHVLLRAAGCYDSVPPGDLEFAAGLAAGYSRAKADSKVEVMVTESKHVIKPRGAKPGLVTVRQYKTLIVKPLRID